MATQKSVKKNIFIIHDSRGNFLRYFARMKICNEDRYHNCQTLHEAERKVAYWREERKTKECEQALQRDNKPKFLGWGWR